MRQRFTVKQACQMLTNLIISAILTETPLATVSGLSLTNDNYVHAVELLEERFASPQLLIHSHMEKLVKLPKIRTMNSVKDLRHVHD